VKFIKATAWNRSRPPIRRQRARLAERPEADLGDCQRLAPDLQVGHLEEIETPLSTSPAFLCWATKTRPASTPARPLLYLAPATYPARSTTAWRIPERNINLTKSSRAAPQPALAVSFLPRLRRSWQDPRRSSAAGFATPRRVCQAARSYPMATHAHPGEKGIIAPDSMDGGERRHAWIPPGYARARGQPCFSPRARGRHATGYDHHHVRRSHPL